MDERSLIESAVRGDEEAFARLVSVHRPFACRIAAGLLSDPDAAEDVAQDLLVRMKVALPGFRGDAELKTWVYRVTLNLCRDSLRRRHRRATDVSIEEAPIEQATVSADRPAHALDVERARAALDTALARLPKDQREAVVLRFIADLPYSEIARTTDTAQGTVASRVFRALKRLGEELEPRHMEVLK